MKQLEDGTVQLESKEELNTIITNTVAEVIKNQGSGQLERVKGIFADPNNPSKEIEGATKTDRFRKWFSAFIDNNLSSGLLTKATLVEGSGSGSYIVPVEYANEIAAQVGAFGKARKYASVVRPGTLSLKIPDMTTDVAVTIPGENTAFSESIPTLAQKTLTLKVVGALSPFSNELLEDNNVDMLSFLSRRFGLGIAKFEDTHTFGSSTSYFTPMLALSSAATVTSASTSITGINADELQDMRRAVSEDFWGNAKYFMHPYVLAYIEQIKDSTGNYIVRQPADSSQNRTLWGHEIVTVSGMPSADAAATTFIGFGDASFCYLGIRDQVALKLLDQATLTTAGNLAEKYLSAIRVTGRFGQVWTCEAGVSIWKTKA